MKFRADRVRTLRKFFMKVGRKEPHMANMNHWFAGDMSAPTCESVGCVEGWTVSLFGNGKAYSHTVLGIGKTEPVLSNGHCLFDMRHTNKLGWQEALDRLTLLLKDRGLPLRGEEAPRKQVPGLDF